jgi:hypothetical protein
VAEQIAEAAPGPLPLRNPWLLAALGIALAAALSMLLFGPGIADVNPFSVLAVVLALMAAEWFSLHFEFRRQSYSASASELSSSSPSSRSAAPGPPRLALSPSGWS